MLSQVVGGLLPLAMGVALSPVPIIAVILMLATPRARANGAAFATGWVLGLVVVSVIVLVVASGSDESGSTASDGVNWVTLGIGLLFLAMAVKQWRSRPKRGEAPTMPKWMATIDSFTARKSFALGLLLSGVNPKNLALTVAAAASVAQAGLSTSETSIAVAVFVLLGSVTVVGPVAWYLLASDKAAGPLETVKHFMSDHNAAIMCAILLVLGAKLIGNGLAVTT